MIIQANGFVVRFVKDEDIPLLAKWLSNPNVLQYYEGRDNPFNEERVKKKFFNRGDHVSRCIFQYKGIPIGYVQFYPVTNLKEYKDIPNVYGMDQFIGEPEYWNQGIGTKLVKTVVNYLTSKLQAERIIMDPRVENVRAIHCYEKCGFVKRKLLPKHEWHEGEYRDCWLMEYRK